MIAGTLLRNKTAAGLAVALTLCLLAPLASAQAFAQGLEVISILPQGRVERITQVVVRFNLAMIPLGTGPGPSPPLEIRPLPKGRYRWLDTHTLSYILDRPLSGASRLLIKVPAGARSLSGAVLAKTKKAQAFTPEIAAVRILPQPKHPLGPRPEIKLVLNQPVDLQSLVQRTWFIAGGRRFPAEVSQGQLPRWERRLPHLARLYLLRCSEELPMGQKVTLRVEPGVIPAQGDIPLRRPIEVQYPAYKTLALIKHQMPRALTGGSDPTASLLLQFNNPVTAKQVWEHLEIRPTLPLPEDDLSTYPSRWVHLALKFEPRRTYSVVLKPGLKDAYETTMSQARKFELRMGDLDPRLHLPKGQGVLEAIARPLLPVRFRNLQKMQVGLRFYEPDQVVPALVAESERPWNKPAPAPKADEPGAVSQQVTLEAPPNRIAVHNLDLAGLLQRSPQGGLTLVDIRASWPDPKGKIKKRVRRSLVQITDLGLSLKLGQASGVAWVTQLSTGRPRSDVALELRDRRNRILWQGRSDQNGVATIPDLKSLAPAKDKKRSWRNPVVYLLAQADEDFAVLPSEWSDELLFSLTENMVRIRPGRAPTMAAHTVFQLPLYQPAQTVRFLVLLRTLGPQGPAVPSARQVEAWIEDPYGNNVYDFKGSSDDFGTLSGGFKLSPSCRLGRFKLFVKTEGQTLSAGSFRVASFRPPDFKVELTPPPEQVGAAPQGPALLQARYMFGTPLAKAKAEVVVRQLQDHFSPSRLKGYVVGPKPLPGDEPRPARKLATLEASLDAEGKTSLTLPPAQMVAGLPLSLSLEAQVKDPSQRAVSARARVRVHPAEIYLGIKTPLLTTVGAPAKISLAAATWDDRPAVPGPVKVTAFRQYWETVREKGPGGFYRYLGRARREKVWETSLDMEKDQTDTEFTPSQSGTYVIVAEAQDQQGRLARSGTYLWVSGQGLSGWRRFDDHRLEMVASDKQVKAGQSLRLMLKNPFAQATALITVERLGVRRTLVRRVEGPAPVVEVPLGQDDAPGVYVGVLLVRGRMGSPRPGGPDLGRPQMRIGYAAVKVEGPDPGLEVEVRPRQLKVRPGAQVEVDLALTRQGKPASGQATILAVDERVLSAAGGRTSYDPRPAFARLQPLAILNADSRTEVIGRVLSALKGESPAGGGGTGPSLRQKFHPAVFWLAQARTNPQGMYTARFNLPDSLTSYRVVAVATDKKGGLGLGQANIIASQPLQLLSALPRFASTGDIFKASVLV
ncbi:MAG: alpha-2-macroglobulin family protein, partial [Desulfarculaceae bacterium]